MAEQRQASTTVTCFACGQAIVAPMIRLESLERTDPREVLWGPVPLHRDCEIHLRPLVEAAGDGVELVWRLVDVADAQSLGQEARPGPAAGRRPDLYLRRTGHPSGAPAT